jgi:hypothetical protein
MEDEKKPGKHGRNIPGRRHKGHEAGNTEKAEG